MDAARALDLIRPSDRSKCRAKALTIFCVFVMTASLLAGCLGSDDEPEVEPDPIIYDPDGEEAPPPIETETGERLRPAVRTQIEQELEAIQIVPKNDTRYDRPNISRDSWYLLSMTSTPQGSVAGFTWEVPSGAAIPRGDDPPVLVLDFAPALDLMGHEGPLPEDHDWLVAIFHTAVEPESQERYLRADHGAVVYGVTRTTETFGAGATGPVVVPPRSDPWTIRIQSGDLLPGQTYFIVVAARSPEEGEFAVGMRVLGEEGLDFTANRSPTEGWDNFTTEVGEESVPLVPMRTGFGEGLLIGEFFEEREDPGKAVRVSTKDVSAEEVATGNVYPLVSSRTLTVSSDAPRGGWSRMAGGYTSEVEYGDVDIDIDLHGTTRHVSETFIHNPIDSRNLGFGWLGDGGGGNPASMAVTVTKSGTLGAETFRFTHIHVGVDLEQMFGVSPKNQIGVTGLS